MAAKGTAAKANLIKRFAEAVGADYVGEKDKKWYFWSEEDGERMQIAVSLTATKTPISIETEPTYEVEAVAVPTTMGEDEKAMLDKLMKELGL